MTVRPDLRDLPRFILGQSMGGAVSLKVHLREPDDWDGMILVAPMCKVSSFFCTLIVAQELQFSLIFKVRFSNSAYSFINDYSNL